MAGIIKHVPVHELFDVTQQVGYVDDSVASKTLVQNDYVSITLFSFAKGEEISTHTSNGDALVECLDGHGQITIDGTPYELTPGRAIVIPAMAPHSLYAPENFRMQLTQVFDPEARQ
ncbi:MAG: cupin domain-containing protein [Atopobiaceae bacterium]